MIKCPHCSNPDESLIEWIKRIEGIKTIYLCIVCGREFEIEES